MENGDAGGRALVLALDANPFGSLSPDALFLLIAVAAQVGAGSAALGEPLGQTDGEHALLGDSEFDCVCDRLQFDVKVDDVATMVVKGKAKQSNTRRGITRGKRPDWKKAIVTLRDGDKIDFFETT